MLVNVCYQFRNPVRPSRARRTPPSCACPFKRLRGRRLHHSRERLRQCNLVELQAYDCQRYVRKIAFDRQFEIASLPVCVFDTRIEVPLAGCLQDFKKTANLAERGAKYGSLKMACISLPIMKIIQPIDIIVWVFRPPPCQCLHGNDNNSPAANCFYGVITVDPANLFDHCLGFAGRNPLARRLFQHNRAFHFRSKLRNFGRKFGKFVFVRLHGSKGR